MFKRSTSLMPLAISLCLLFSCSKNNDASPEDEIGVNPGFDETIEYISVQGIVNPANPLKGAIVSCDNKTTTTDDEGHFFLEHVYGLSSGAVITVNADGYLTTKSTFLFYSYNSIQYTEINMIAANTLPAATFDASKGGDVKITDSINIHFTANQMLKADNTAYTGMVTVGYQIAETTGAYRGIIKKTRRRAGLSVWSNFVVILKGANGEMLHLNNSMTITTPMPAGAPANIRSWCRNAYTEPFERSEWLEDSTVTSNGKLFTFSTRHTAIVLAVPYTYTTKYLNFMDTIAGVPWSNKSITIKLADKSVIRGFTNNRGRIVVSVPKDQDATVSMRYSDCAGIVNTSPVVIKDDTIHVKADHYLQISGSVSNCNNEAVSSAEVIMFFNNILYKFPVDSGRYQAIIQNCANPTEVIISATDYTNKITSASETISVTQDIISKDIKVCL